MENKVKEAVEFKALVLDKFDKEGNQIYYETSWFCNENKTMHPNLKLRLNCKYCTPIIDKIEYEAIKRLEFLIDGYFIHCLGAQFAKLSTERVCELYNVKLNYFRPWI